MKIKRNNKIYDVIKYLLDTQEICVEVEFAFAEYPYKRKLKLWWELKDCKIVEGKNV
jgi:hypothetical protein